MTSSQHVSLVHQSTPMESLADWQTDWKITQQMSNVCLAVPGLLSQWSKEILRLCVIFAYSDRRLRQWGSTARLIVLILPASMSRWAETTHSVMGNSPLCKLKCREIHFPGFTTDKSNPMMCFSDQRTFSHEFWTNVQIFKNVVENGSHKIQM